MIVNFSEKRICVFGLQGSGKSVFCRWFARQFKHTFVYDPMDEYGGLGVVRYVPQFKHYSLAAVNELDKMLKVMLTKVDPIPGLFIIDECNRFAPNRKTLPSQIAYLNDQNRHLHTATCYVARRPVQLNTDLVELSHYLVIFNLAGKNDLQYLEDLSLGLSEAVQELQEHEYVLVDQKREYQIMSPVPLSEPGKKPARVKVAA